MAKVKSGRSKRLVLDIGSSVIRLCELTATKTGYTLTKYYQREVLNDPELSDEDKRTLRVTALKELLAESKIRSKKAVFAVAGRSVFTRTRALPPVPEYKVTQIVQYEIQQQIPFALDQIALDYQVVDRTEAGGYEVMMAAIKVDVVEKELDLLKEVKRDVEIVDVCPLAAYNWIKHVGGFGDQGDCVALIDMGAATTDIVIEREGQFRFTRPLNLGGNDITRAVSKEFGLSFTDAERLKRERGFAPTGDPQRDGRGGEVIGKVLTRLVSEINRSFGYFRSLPGGGPVTRVIITGGAACLRNMGPFLQRELGLDVRLAQPLAGIEIGPDAKSVQENAQHASVVLGLAFRCLSPVPIEINLVPPRVIEASRRKEQAFYWALVLVTFVLIMASIIPVRANENKSVQEQLKNIERAVSMYDPEMVGNTAGTSRFAAEMDQEKSKVQGRRNQVEMLDGAIKKCKFWLGQINAVNDARPEGNKVWFSSLESTEISQGGPKGDKKSAGGYSSSGFPGLSPSDVKGANLTGGSGALMDPKSRSKPPANPNGLSIIGYARDTESLIEFITNLRALYGEKGVSFFEGLVKEVSITQLDNAQVSGKADGAAAGPGPAARGQTVQTGPAGETVLTLRVDIEFGKKEAS